MPDRPTSSLPEDPLVAVLRWPEEDDRRHALSKLEVPRLLLLADDAEPPAAVDHLEDWVRTPVTAVELARRTDSLRRRAPAARPRPVLDDGGILRFRDRWVVIPDGQLPVVDLLVRRLGGLVRTAEVVSAYESVGGTASPNGVSTLLYRIRRRVGDLGLELHVVRRRGVILDIGIERAASP